MNKTTTPTETRGASHTPGPWRVAPYLTPEHDDDPMGVYKVEPAYTEIGADYFALGEAEPDAAFDVRVHGRNEANARLIAAAPELLEALRLALAHIEENDADSVSHRYNHVTNAARAAIIKAKGQP